MKDLYEDIRQIKSIEDGKVTFEINNIVLVTDTAKEAQSIRQLMEEPLQGFTLYAGYINSNGDFEEIKS